MDRHILAISGGGFSTEETSFIDEYLLKIARKQGPLNIAFIAAASHDAQGYIDAFYWAFQSEKPSHLSIKDFESPNIQEVVNDLDIIYVGGGDTRFMIEVWQRTGFDQVLRNAYQNGVILAGISAGAMCWFETCYSENEEDEYEEFPGLGFLSGSFCPHYNKDKRRNEFDNWAAVQTNISAFYRLEDNENLHFKNEKLAAKITT
ncbi:Type 1 glutamine amidotransferase-like domain-containing protein [Falsibacillus pallidus]|uniref:Type 1 glutamine amidotransferase-like domain-containing protein n=1 Tax=Falsibacillus pallidus TaxID=493781 RepID=UPI003D95A984